VGYIHHRRGDHVRAVTCYRKALDIIREFGALREEADTLTRLAEALDGSEEYEAARGARRAALHILDELEGPAAHGLRASLHAGAAAPGATDIRPPSDSPV
jgi:tetratricopeptide (TPR) repeat protein